MKTTISFISLVLLLAGLNYYGKPSESPKGFICPINVMQRMSRPPISGDNGEVPTTPEFLAFVAALDAELPIKTVAGIQHKETKPPPDKPNPAKPNPAQPKVT